MNVEQFIIHLFSFVNDIKSRSSLNVICVWINLHHFSVSFSIRNFLIFCFVFLQEETSANNQNPRKITTQKMTVDRLNYLPAASVTHQHTEDDATSKSWKIQTSNSENNNQWGPYYYFHFKKQINVWSSRHPIKRLDGNSFTWNRKTGKVDIIICFQSVQQKTSVSVHIQPNCK